MTIKNLIKKTLTEKIIPLMMSVSIITTFMYIYNKKMTLIFALASFIINLMIFCFYDYFSKKGAVGRYCSILGGFIIVAAVLYMMASGNSGDNGVDFMIWFLSPQEAVDYSARYTYTLFIGINVFTASTIYYFTQVRYRILVTFLIMFIPLAVFAKEDETVPVPLLALLLILYTAVMIHCRQTADSEQDRNVRKILDSSYKKSAAIFVLSAALISFAVPKPEFEANREIFESMISANRLTQYLLSKLGDFSDTSGSSGFSGKLSDAKLFYCYSDEPINLKARTYTYYNPDDDRWYLNNSYDRDFYSQWQEEQINLNPADFLNTVYTACGYNSDFAEKYNIKYKNPADYNLDEYTRQLTIIPLRLNPEFLLVPSHTFGTKENEPFLMSPSGEVILYSEENQVQQRIYRPANINYYSDILSDSQYARDILENLNIENYSTFLSDLKKILSLNDADENLLQTTDKFTEDYENAVNYYNGNDFNASEEKAENLIYSLPAETPQLNDETIGEIEKLAHKVTDDYSSDIDKAEALETYFIRNEFTYDASYIKPEGHNAVDFLFTDKKGVCYEYATAMILMARSVGIPARYCEGFMVTDYDENQKVFSVSEENSHAYPELFISGYGWLVFEPTISDDVSQQNKFIGSQQFIISLICISVFILIILALIFIKKIFPALYEKYFRVKLRHTSPEKSVSMTMKRLRRLSSADECMTSSEFSDFLSEKYGCDISEIVSLYDIYIYGNYSPENYSRSQLISIYENACEKIRENIRKSYKKS